MARAVSPRACELDGDALSHGVRRVPGRDHADQELGLEAVEEGAEPPRQPVGPHRRRDRAAGPSLLHELGHARREGAIQALDLGPQVVVEPHQAPCLAPQRPVLVEDRLGVQVEQQEALEALGARLELRDLLFEASVRLLL